MAGDRLFRLIAAGLFASVLLSACGGGGGGGSGGGGDVGDGRVAVVEDETPPISPPTGGVAVVEDETPPIDEENKSPPPEIMKADSDSPLSSQEQVLAATESGAALLTVTISNGGELLPFADANGFSSEGGSVAVISLSRAAAALFTADGLVMSLVLTATNAGGTVLSTVSFASSALGIDGAGLTLHLTTALLRSETELFAATDASLTIWHNGDKEEKYELSGLGWDLFTVGADGGVSVVDDLPVSGEGAFYGLTLRLTDGAVDAERSLSLRLTPPQTETTPPRTEAPPLPEIEGELLGETKLVNALSGSGTALLAVTVSNGGALLSFSDANGFASDGGAVAVISLARPATALFTLDGLTLSLALTATNAGGTVSETVSFASSARGFDGLGLSLHLTTALLRPETELFAATDSRLTIWHNGGKKESYELSGLDSELFATGADGGVRVASDLPVSGEGALYELTLRLTDGAAIAERLLFLRLTPPLPEIEGELLGETKLVDALSGSGTALLAVTVSNGGELSPFADAGFASGGGAVAVISLARSAAALFTLDGLTLSLALTATNAGGTVSATVSFASSARGFDGLGLSLHLTTALLRSETELFAAADARLTIWHNDGKKESYELSGLDSQLFAAGADGGVRVAGNLPVSGEGAFYELTLRLTDGAEIAERLLFLRLTPPLPEIEGELLGETKLVNALSGSGTALLAVTVSNGGALSPFTDANGFASGGGAVAVISLARSATALFTLDGLTLSLALTATSAGGTVSETVSFASSAREFDGLGLSLHLTTALLRPETELFAAADASLTIWHNDGKEESYELSGLDSQLFAADADGGVRVASDLPVSGEGAFYELTLRLTDGAAIAERLLFLRLTPPLPEIEGVSGETKLVDALSGSGTALLAVTVSNGGALSPIADTNGFASGGGAVAVISLARPATALFTLDGLALSLALTATNAGGTVSATVSFASSARGFNGLGLSLHLTTALLRPETELFAATDSRLTIWHNDGKEENYELSGLDSQLFAADADGEVRVAADLPVSGEGAFYELTLRLTDGAAIAERLLFLRLTPPLPEIEGELLGEVKLVNALSGSGTALLAVTVSSGGALLSFTDANGFASDGGAVAVISLARSAAALFTLDNLTLSLALTATSAGGTVSATVSFASSARGFDGLGLSLHLTTALLRPETELFAAADSRLTIWHNDGKEESYELSGLGSELFAAGADGGVRVAGDLPVSGEGAFYELTLRLTDGAEIAERLLFLRLTPPPPEIEGELSGETKLVNALSGSGTALLAVTVSNGGELLSFAGANGFASGGGAVAVISLARSATALFTRDGLTLSLALTATNAGGTVSETVSFASSARGFDGLGLSLHLTTALLRLETELFAAADSRLTIWHNDGKEESYELSGLDSELFATDADGGVRVAGDLPVSGEGAFYGLTLRLTDGAAVAERLLFLRLTPPLPEIEGELLGETKLVNALSGSGTALLAVTVSNGGALSPFTDTNGFASGGGAVAVISLARSATALFTLDGLTLSLALTATNAGGTVSEVVSFASSARGFDGLGLSLHLTTALLRPETELFAATDSRLTIWHNDGKEESYELSGLDSQLFAADADGEVRVAADLPVSGEGAFYELTLRLTDGAATAERLLFLRLTPPLPEIEGVLSSETKLVNALSGSGTALLAVTVSNGGVLLSFADANGFASEGGAVAVISLARSAAALFTLDGLTLSLALTATNAGGTVSATVSFVSSALGINGAGLFASFATAMLPSETEVFAAADARLTIWHNDNAQETYELSGTDASLFAVDVNGGVRTASDLSSEDDLLYELTLRLTDGAAIAERLLTLALLPPPIAVDVEVECAGQWPCRDQFAAALSAAIESGEATLDHGQAVVIDLEGGTHGSEVHSVFQLYGIGASVSLTLAEDEDLPRGGFILHTPDAFLELPAKKKQIVAHSVADLIAPAETLEEKDAIVAQAAANLYHPFPSFYRTTRRPDAPALITAAVETGLMVVVGGIAKTSERYELNSGYTEIDFDKRYTYKDYCDGTRKHKGTGGPPNVITLNGEEYCSVFDRCGWMQNYCLVAPAIDVVITETGQREEGTSYAAPQAAAALQMLGTMWPELSQRELALMLLELADDIGEAGIDDVYGHGALSFRRLYEPGGLSSFIVGDEIFRFSCDADANTCQKSPIENVDSENEENKQPPEIIKADSDSPLSPQKPVLAAAESGTALLTVTVSNGELSPFADANGFASGGGAVAVISLARSAAALFTLDGLTLSLALTATNAGGTVSATVSFASSALGIDGAGLFASFATVMLPSETEVFAAADARLTIWHNGDKQETYELAGADASLFAVDVNGGVRTASDLSSSEDNLLYELTLRLTDGAAVAERLLTLALLPPPIAVDMEVECAGQWPCRDQFAAALSAAIESGEATLDHERGG